MLNTLVNHCRFLTYHRDLLAGKNATKFNERFSFVLVRNPWQRLLSAYIQKFLEEPQQGVILCQFHKFLPHRFTKFK